MCSGDTQKEAIYFEIAVSQDVPQRCGSNRIPSLDYLVALGTNETDLEDSKRNINPPLCHQQEAHILPFLLASTYPLFKHQSSPRPRRDLIYFSRIHLSICGQLHSPVSPILHAYLTI